MQHFRLMRTSAKTFEGFRAQIVYHYQSDAECVSFCAHPEYPFAFVLVDGEQRCLDRIVKSFLLQTMRQHEFGAFEEAVETLSVPETDNPPRFPSSSLPRMPRLASERPALSCAFIQPPRDLDPWADVPLA